MLYEERRLRLVSEGDWATYRSWAMRTLWPSLQRDGHRVVCVLNGLIGKGVQDVLIIVGYSDFAARQAAQPLFMGQSELVQEEEIHLLQSSPYTEGRGVNVEDRRNIYGVRRWWIEPKDWDEFVRLSYEGIWPAMDHVRPSSMIMCPPRRPMLPCQFFSVAELRATHSIVDRVLGGLPVWWNHGGYDV